MAKKLVDPKGCPLTGGRMPRSPEEPVAMHTYMDNRSMLTDYAAKVIGSREQAEDIVQEAWVTLQSQRGATDVRDPIGYMRRLVRNLAIDKLRQRMRENRLLGADMESAVRTAADPAATPDQALFAKRDLACVLRVLRSLPERQRVAIEMSRFGNYKLREIGVHLGISLSLAHQLISDGITACATRCGIDRLDLR